METMENSGEKQRCLSLLALYTTSFLCDICHSAPKFNEKKIYCSFFFAYQLHMGHELRYYHAAVFLTDDAWRKDKQMENQKMEIGVIGLGKFGLQMARTLVQLGHTVVGLDDCENRVQLSQEALDTVYKGDATNVSVLKSLRFQDLDCVMVSVGQAMEKSLSITLNLQELNIPRIWVKATNAEHRKILRRLGVDHAILPEHDAATMSAHQISNPGMLDLIPKYGGILVQELTVDRWAGKTLLDLNLMSAHEVMVIGIKGPEAHEYLFVPPARTELKRGDVLIVVGRQAQVKGLHP